MIAIYARQSVEKKDSISIDTQIQSCVNKIVDHSNNELPQYKVYKDEGYSGSNIKRPAFEQMMEDINGGTISKAIVYKLDRISRSLLDFVQIYETFKKHNVEFISCNEQFDTSTPMGTAMLNIIMVFAQLERETIQLRIKDNYYARGEKGFYLGGRAPFGYNKIPTNHNGKKTYTFEENKDQAVIVKSLFEEYANTDVSIGQLAKKLNTQEINTNNANTWSSVPLGRLLRNPVYVKADVEVYKYLKNKGANMNNGIEDYKDENGLYLYGCRQGVKTMKFTNIDGNYVTIGLHKGIVEPDIWLQCQYKLDNNKQVKNNGKGTHSWLSGLMKCGYCGLAINAVNGYKDVLYINCGGRKKGICYDRKRTIKVKEIEEVVELELLGKMNELKVRKNINIHIREKEINILKIEQVKTEERIANLINSLSESTDSTIKYVDNEINRLDRELKEIYKKITNIEMESNRKEIIKEDLQEYINNWDTYSLEHKKAVAKLLINKITITDDEINIEYNI